VVIRLCKRLTLTSTNARIVRPVFGDEVRKELPIPKVIDEYNHYMNGVDRANQLRAKMTVCRPYERCTWLLMWQFSIDTVINNSFLCWKYNRPHNSRDHAAFQRDLALALLTHPLEWEATGRVPKGLERWPGHEWGKFQSRNYCKWCRLTTKAHRRLQALAELVNGVLASRIRGRSTTGGCRACRVHLCSTGSCFDLFHSHKQ